MERVAAILAGPEPVLAASFPSWVPVGGESVTTSRKPGAIRRLALGVAMLPHDPHVAAAAEARGCMVDLEMLRSLVEILSGPLPAGLVPRWIPTRLDEDGASLRLVPDAAARQLATLPPQSRRDVALAWSREASVLRHWGAPLPAVAEAVLTPICEMAHLATAEPTAGLWALCYARTEP